MSGIDPSELVGIIELSPDEQVAFFKARPGIIMKYDEWENYYCATTEHKGLHCSSCLGEEEYSGEPVFDDKCCCKASEVK